MNTGHQISSVAAVFAYFAFSACGWAQSAPSPVAAIDPTQPLCATQVKPTMPRKAGWEQRGGVVKVKALIRDGVVREVLFESGPFMFQDAVRTAMKQYRCQVVASDIVATQEFVFDTRAAGTMVTFASAASASE